MRRGGWDAGAVSEASGTGQVATAEARLLVVDDEPNIVELLSASLRFAGFEVATAPDGPTALRQAREFRPDLVVLDVMMPGMDGPTTLQAMYRIPTLAAVPVVFVTAKAQPAEVARLRELGAADVIAKPFDPMTLPDKVREVWRRLGR